MADYDKSTRSLVSDLIGGVNRLIRQEIRLAQAEGSEKIAEASAGAISIAAGTFIAMIALLVLVQALVVALANYMPASLAALLVGVVLAIIAFALVMNGRNNLSASNLTLPRTRATLRSNTEYAAEKVR
jgi:uncharacterized membrane protein